MTTAACLVAPVAPVVFVIRGEDPTYESDRAGLFGYEPTVYLDRAAAEARLSDLRSAEVWGPAGLPAAEVGVRYWIDTIDVAPGDSLDVTLCEAQEMRDAGVLVNRDRRVLDVPELVEEVAQEIAAAYRGEGLAFCGMLEGDLDEVDFAIDAATDDADVRSGIVRAVDARVREILEG